MRTQTNDIVRITKDEAHLALRGLLLALTSESAQQFLTDADCLRMEKLIERLAPAVGIKERLMERLDGFNDK